MTETHPPAPLAGQASTRRRGADAVRVVELRGEIDPSNAATIFAAVTPDVTRSEAVVIDLTHVAFFDSSGIRELIRFGHERLVHVVAPRGGPPRRVLELTCLVDVLPTFETVDAALDAIAAPDWRASKASAVRDGGL